MSMMYKDGNPPFSGAGFGRQSSIQTSNSFFLSLLLPFLVSFPFFFLCCCLVCIIAIHHTYTYTNSIPSGHCKRLPRDWLLSYSVANYSICSFLRFF